MQKRFLKISEFARLCGTTRDTLLHYDRKGLLKPRIVHDNGYRAYGVEQYFSFDFINLFKETGCTLEEIRRLRTGGKSGTYLDFLKKRVAILKEEEQRLARRLAKLAQLVRMAEEAANAEPGMIFFEDRQEERALFYPVDAGKMTSWETSGECYSECVLSSLGKGSDAEMPLGTVISEQSVADDSFAIGYVFRKAVLGEQGDIRAIPAGHYACLFHKGSIQEHRKASRNMMLSLLKQGKTPTGNVYMFDQMSYVLEDASQQYTAKLMVRV